VPTRTRKNRHVRVEPPRQYAQDHDQRRVNSMTLEAWNMKLRKRAAANATPEERRRKLRVVGGISK